MVLTDENVMEERSLGWWKNEERLKVKWSENDGNTVFKTLEKGYVNEVTAQILFILFFFVKSDCSNSPYFIFFVKSDCLNSTNRDESMV